MLATNTALTRLWAVASSVDRKDTLSVSEREFRHRQEGRRSGQWPHESDLPLQTTLASCGQETDVQHTGGMRAPSTRHHTATSRT